MENRQQGSRNFEDKLFAIFRINGQRPLLAEVDGVEGCHPNKGTDWDGREAVVACVQVLEVSQAGQLFRKVTDAVDADIQLLQDNATMRLSSGVYNRVE